MNEKGEIDGPCAELLDAGRSSHVTLCNTGPGCHHISQISKGTHVTYAVSYEVNVVTGMQRMGSVTCLCFEDSFMSNSKSLRPAARRVGLKAAASAGAAGDIGSRRSGDCRCLRTSVFT